MTELKQNIKKATHILISAMLKKRKIITRDLCIVEKPTLIQRDHVYNRAIT